MPLAGVSPGYRLALPPLPEGAGEEAGGRAGWGLRGGIYEFRHLGRGGGSRPLPGPLTPGAKSHHGPLYGRSGEQSVSSPYPICIHHPGFRQFGLSPRLMGLTVILPSR